MSDQQDVRTVIECIAEAFSELDVDRWLSYFNHQHTFLHGETVFLAQSLNDTKEAFAPMIESLREAGFKRSVLDLCNIKILGSEMSIATTLWRRLGENDTLIEDFGATYTLLKTSAGWKVVVAAVHDEIVLFD